ncbi:MULTISPECIES: hypothetical protein [unclassified Nonomuraea]|uniref:hypothetical protein n=1 Tax=unclassified Nonomuraea TaxID=2593643 RepID=UPI0033F30157
MIVDVVRAAISVMQVVQAVPPRPPGSGLRRKLIAALVEQAGELRPEPAEQPLAEAFATWIELAARREADPAAVGPRPYAHAAAILAAELDLALAAGTPPPGAGDTVARAGLFTRS